MKKMIAVGTTTVTDLPDELLGLIVPRLDLRDLLSLAGTNRAFRAAVDDLSVTQIYELYFRGYSHAGPTDAEQETKGQAMRYISRVREETLGFFCYFWPHIAANLVSEKLDLLLQFGVLEHARVDVRQRAIKTICNLSYYPSGRDAVMAAGVVPALVPLIVDTDVTVQQYAIKTISNLSSNPATRAAVVAANVVPILVRSLADLDATVRKYTVETICNLSGDPATRAAVVAANGVPSLVGCLPDSDVIVQRYAAETICNLSSDPATRAAVVKANAAPSLVARFGDWDETVRRYSVETIYNLANDPDTRAAVVAANPVPSLLRQIYPGNEFSQSANQILALLQLMIRVKGVAR
ncbi:MAG: HEAT repeat domain-containing protein [Candidatus Margulisiibacteriota bacterium]